MNGINGIKSPTRCGHRMESADECYCSLKLWRGKFADLMRLHLHIGMRGPRLNAKDRQENVVIAGRIRFGGYSGKANSFSR